MLCTFLISLIDSTIMYGPAAANQYFNASFVAYNNIDQTKSNKSN